MPPRTEALAEAIAIMARLRAPDGCPWDRAQTFDTIKRHTLEETYEVFDAIDRSRTSSATSCCKSSSTPRWPMRPATSPSKMSPPT
jgi:hypothetical protein